MSAGARGGIVTTMTAPPRPLRILYRKYANQVPASQKQTSASLTDEHSAADKLVRKPESKSLSNLNRLGRETSTLERIHMYLAMSEDRFDCAASFVNSSVCSASTNGRSVTSKRDARESSPTRFRSRSQEFQSKYKLAASRYSPERQIPPHNLQHNHQHPINSSCSNNNSNCNNNRIALLPKLPITGKFRASEDSETANVPYVENGRTVLQSMIDERKTTTTQIIKPVEITNYQYVDLRESVACPARSESNHSSREDGAGKMHVQINQLGRVAAGQLARCPTRSTVDADRMDSSHYQYLLNDFSSITSSTTIRSVKSDPASTQASARAQRPSTTGTVGTAARLRDLYTRTTDMTTPAQPPTVPPSILAPTRNVSSKSPETQWPPRYAVLPSWPSYEDVSTLNSCGDHRALVARFYANDHDLTYGRRTRERAHRVNFRHLEQQQYENYRQAVPRQKVHVVPSHTSTECAMCNLYRHQAESTACPPNTPLVSSSHEHHRHGQQLHNPSVASTTSASMRVLPSAANTHHSTTSAKASSQRYTHSSHEASRRGFPTLNSRKYDSVSTPGGQSASVTSSEMVSKSTPMPFLPPAKQLPHRTGGRDVSYTWDTCKLTYINAHA